MSSRARVFAAVTLLSSCLAGSAAWAQATNLEAGKSASQLFAGTCNACHMSPRGLLKTVSPGALPGFLREHYTTGGDMASQLSTYLISNGASDSKQTKQGTDKQDKQGANGDQPERQGRKNRNTPAQEAARPDDAPPPAETGRQGRRRQATPGETPEEGKPATNAPAQAATERGPDGRKLSAKQRNRPGRPPGTDEPSMANEPPKAETKPEPARVESGPDDRVKGEPKEVMGNAGVKPDAVSKPGDEPKSEPAKLDPAKSEAAKIEAPKDNTTPSADKPMARRDTVPAATPAPSAAASTPVPSPAVASGSSSEPPAAQPKAPASSEAPAMSASTPPPAPAGPPPPPMSQ
jgi:hypothetical protein